MESPFTLLSVAAGDPVQQELLPSPSPRCQPVRVTIPLVCQVRDRNGCVCPGVASLEVEVMLRLQVPQCECWHASLLIQPCVRLACLPCCTEQPMFDAYLEVLVEAYFVHWEQTNPAHPQPRCPELPLYPELRIDNGFCQTP